MTGRYETRFGHELNIAPTTKRTRVERKRDPIEESSYLTDALGREACSFIGRRRWRYGQNIALHQDSSKLVRQGQGNTDLQLFDLPKDVTETAKAPIARWVRPFGVELSHRPGVKGGKSIVQSPMIGPSLLSPARHIQH